MKEDLRVVPEVARLEVAGLAARVEVAGVVEMALTGAEVVVGAGAAATGEDAAGGEVEPLVDSRHCE